MITDVVLINHGHRVTLFFFYEIVPVQEMNTMARLCQASSLGTAPFTPASQNSSPSYSQNSPRKVIIVISLKLD